MAGGSDLLAKLRVALGCDFFGNEFFFVGLAEGRQEHQGLKIDGETPFDCMRFVIPEEYGRLCAGVATKLHVIAVAVSKGADADKVREDLGKGGSEVVELVVEDAFFEEVLVLRGVADLCSLKAEFVERTPGLGVVGRPLKRSELRRCRYSKHTFDVVAVPSPQSVPSTDRIRFPSVRPDELLVADVRASPTFQRLNGGGLKGKLRVQGAEHSPEATRPVFVVEKTDGTLLKEFV